MPPIDYANGEATVLEKPHHVMRLGNNFLQIAAFLHFPCPPMGAKYKRLRERYARRSRLSEGSLGCAMKKRCLIITVSAAIFALGVVGAGNAFADRGHYHGHVGVIVGPYWGPWYSPAPYYYPPVVFERSAPPVYIEQPVPTEHSVKNEYWYYCQSRGGYYPDVRECPDGWLKVLPRP